MTHNNGTWDAMPTLLPWQPSQRITILQHATTPTTLAAVDKCISSSPSSSRLCLAAGGFFSDKVASLPLRSGRNMNQYHGLFAAPANIKWKCHICIGSICGGETLLLMLLLYSLVRKYISKVNKQCCCSLCEYFISLCCNTPDQRQLLKKWVCYFSTITKGSLF